MTLSQRMEGWLAIANAARFKGRDRVANYALRRMKRLIRVWS